ncbi:heterogeneous nuclear ribonucleoprotein [Stylonychia lemnae]|uniref:Heterogeneous nuclear ribonucleoprotein n=1 Tax=Stylonychia lemnae TaxID=5949 RepID=A0A077ZP04_STYLE|nr:heterogeneous nuclear ribonucleoprotein [Stylonychia lemnae]|eukprot:CDW71643.1 heterogeneous nuclear ribonucleoprotein [Stylonychia lemnae]
MNTLSNQQQSNQQQPFSLEALLQLAGSNIQQQPQLSQQQQQQHAQLGLQGGMGSLNGGVPPGNISGGYPDNLALIAQIMQNQGGQQLQPSPQLQPGVQHQQNLSNQQQPNQQLRGSMPGGGPQPQNQASQQQLVSVVNGGGGGSSNFQDQQPQQNQQQSQYQADLLQNLVRQQAAQQQQQQILQQDQQISSLNNQFIAAPNLQNFPQNLQGYQNQNQIQPGQALQQQSQQQQSLAGIVGLLQLAQSNQQPSAAPQIQQLLGALSQFSNLIALSQIANQLGGGNVNPQTTSSGGLTQPQQPEEEYYSKYFIGGISYSAKGKLLTITVQSNKESDIEKYFKQYGQVVDVAIMRDKNTGKSRGFAFVTFKEYKREAVRELTSRLLKPPTPHMIQNRMIEVREGDGSKPPDSFLDKQQAAAAQREKDRQKGRRDDRDHRNNDRDRDRERIDMRRKHRELERLETQGVKDKIFVGGLDYQLTDQLFREHFSQYGEVKDAQIVREQNTGASKGFGFITYFDDRIAKKLITEVQVSVMNGRKVDIRTAEPKLSEKIAIINKAVQEDPESRRGGNRMNRDNRRHSRDRRNDNQRGNDRNRQRSRSRSQRGGNFHDKNRKDQYQQHNNDRDRSQKGGSSGSYNDRNSSNMMDKDGNSTQVENSNSQNEQDYVTRQVNERDSN